MTNYGLEIVARQRVQERLADAERRRLAERLAVEPKRRLRGTGTLTLSVFRRLVARVAGAS